MSAVGDSTIKSQAAPPKLRKKARAAARQRLKIMPSSKTALRPGVDPSQNNPNSIGAVIIPPGTPSL